MSVFDELKGLEDRVRQRMSELQPLIEEYQALEQVAQRLGLAAPDASGSEPSMPASAPERKPVAASGARKSKPAAARSQAERSAGLSAQAATAKQTPRKSKPAAKQEPTTDAAVATKRKRAPAPKRTRPARAAGDIGKTPSATAGSTRRRQTTRRGQRDEDVLALVKQRPGLTVRDAAGELGIDPTGLYRVVHRLEQQGAIKKRGRQLQPN